MTVSLEVLELQCQHYASPPVCLLSHFANCFIIIISEYLPCASHVQ